MPVRRSWAALVGRRRELGELEALLGAHERLTTLVGPAGVGKTRLLTELGESIGRVSQPAVLTLVSADGPRQRRVAAAGASAPVFCDLSATHSGEEVVFALARAFEVELGPSREASEAEQRLADAIEARAVPVLVDNAEQVVDSVRSLLRSLLSLSQNARFVVTSRVPIGLPDEVCVRLEPLPVAEAVELLLRVVRRAAPGAEWERAPASVLEEIVTRVDRLPLALQLVGARARLLSAEQALERLHGQLDFLHARGEEPDARHASVRRALEWSWELLDRPHRRVLEQLSVFQGSFTVTAAEALVEREPESPPTLDVLDTLVDHSLVQTSSPGEGGEVRLSLFVAVQELAREHLAKSGREQSARERHAAYFVERAAHALDAAKGDLRYWRALEEHLDDFRAASAFSLEPEPARAARLLIAQSWILRGRMHLGVQRQLLQEAAQAAERAGDTALRLDAAMTLVPQLGNAGFLSEVVTKDEACDLARSIGDRVREGRALNSVEYAAIGLDREELARDALERARVLGEQTGDAFTRCNVLMHSGMLYEEPIDASVKQFDEVVALGRATGGPRVVWFGLENRIEQRSLQGTEPADSPDLIELGKLNEIAADSQMLAWYELVVSRHAFSAAELAIAAEAAGRALAAARAFGSRASQCVALALAAEVALDTGDGAARRQILEAREISSSVEHRWVFAHVSRVYGQMCEDEGDLGGAISAFEDVLSVRIGDHHVCHREDARVSLALARLSRDGLDPELPALCASVERAESAGALAAAAIGAAHIEAIGRMLGDSELRTRGHERLERMLERVVDRRVRGLVRMLRGEASDSSYLTRRAARLLSAIERAHASSLPRLVIAADLSWAELQGKRIALGRRGAPRRILGALIERHAGKPGVPLGVDEVCAAGWPGERMLTDSARTRVYNAVRILRDLGLGSRILTRDDGYLLDPALRVEVGPT